MPPRPRKTTPSKAAEPKPDEVAEPNAAEAAVAELEDGPITFEWRGTEFTVARDVLGNARWRLGMAAGRYEEVLLAAFASSDDKLAYNRFMALIGPDDNLTKVAAEYLDALAAAAGWGNS